MRKAPAHVFPLVRRSRSPALRPFASFSPLPARPILPPYSLPLPALLRVPLGAASPEFMLLELLLMRPPLMLPLPRRESPADLSAVTPRAMPAVLRVSSGVE